MCAIQYAHTEISYIRFEHKYVSIIEYFGYLDFQVIFTCIFSQNVIGENVPKGTVSQDVKYIHCHVLMSTEWRYNSNAL